MQAATNLKAGMTCHTNGFHASGDGGAAYYTVDTSGTANGMDVLALQGGLKATLIFDDSVSVMQLGAKGDGITSDVAFVNRAMALSDNVLFADKSFAIDADITIDNKTVRLMDAEIVSNGKTVYVANESSISDGTLTNTCMVIQDAKNSVHDILFKNWAGAALTVGGYENFVRDIRLENDSNSETIGIDVIKSDNSISSVYGYGAHLGMRVNASNCYINNVHLWLTSSNLFAGSRFVEVSATLVSFTDCCCDSYETLANITNDFLLINFFDCYWITNGRLFASKAYKLFNCSGTHNHFFSGKILCNLSGVASSSSTLEYGSIANVDVTIINGDLKNAIVKDYNQYTLDSGDEYVFQRDGYIIGQTWNDNSYLSIEFLVSSGQTYNTVRVTNQIKGQQIYVPTGTRIRITKNGTNCSCVVGLISGYKEVSV